MMNQKFNLEQGTYRILYYRYKALIVPIIAIIICFFVFLNFIIPQIQDLFSAREEEEQLRQKISILKENVTFLSNLNDSDLESKIKIVHLALPPEKDFVGILNAITKASNNAGVYVNDYVFRVGELSTISAQPSADTPSIQIKISTTGNIEKNKSFISELNKSLPLAEITDLQMTKNSASLTLIFYYKLFSPLKFNNYSALHALSKKDLDLIEKLSKWNNISSNNYNLIQLITSPSTLSGKLQ